jgi:signal transduction histidine kinase
MNESIHGERTASEQSGDRTHRATDGYLGSAARHRELAVRPTADFRHDPRERDTPLPRRWGRLRALRGERLSYCFFKRSAKSEFGRLGQRVLPGSPSARLIESKLPVHIADLADPAFRERSPEGSVVDAIGARTYVLVPLLEKDELIGIIGFHRTRVQPFTDTQIALITDFAAQATVALESTRRERRYRETQMELARVNRVATIGQLTASIIHEVNQPLAAARNNLTAALNFLDRAPPDLVEVREALACAVKDNDRVSTVVGRIRALMQKTPIRTDSVDLNEAVREVLELTHGEALEHGISVRTQLADSLPLIQGDRVQLQQVVLNLILNAAQAMGAVTNGTREVLITTSQTEPNKVCLGVQDTGPGLSAETLPRLFEPFYTTKTGGMGMGLAICRSIIEAHGGRLWAAGCEPRGALFQFTIPVD